MATLSSGPLVRVVVPVFNDAATVEDAVRSVLEQTHRNLELVVVDDGSEDGSAERAESSFDERCRLLSRPNGGPAAARNAGVVGSAADFVAFCDADDVWSPQKLTLQLRALAEDPKAVLAYGWVDLVDTDLSVVVTDRRPRFSGSVWTELAGDNFIVSGSNVLIRRAAFETVGGFDESLWGAEDWELHCRLARLGNVRVVPEVLVSYRQRPGSLSCDIGQMAQNYRVASAKVFQSSSDDERALRRSADARYWSYLAVRATQTGRARDLVHAPRLLGRALRSSPGEVLNRLRSSAPLRSLWLTMRALAGGR